MGVRVLSIFPSGRVIDHKDLDEERMRDFAEEFPTIIYTFPNTEKRTSR